jgi:hypothetical protein
MGILLAVRDVIFEMTGVHLNRVWASSGPLFSWLNPGIFCSVLNGFYRKQDIGREFRVTTGTAISRRAFRISTLGILNLEKFWMSYILTLLNIVVYILGIGCQGEIGSILRPSIPNRTHEIRLSPLHTRSETQPNAFPSALYLRFHVLSVLNGLRKAYRTHLPIEACGQSQTSCRPWKGPC